jgi:next-to-BRCA1 protein 1
MITENEPILIHLGESESEHELHETDTEYDAKENVVPRVTTKTPSAASLASSNSTSVFASQFKLPPLAPPMDLYREFWPRVAQELRHLMQESPSSREASPDNVTSQAAPDNVTSEASTHTVTNPFLQTASLIESPLTGEALLKRPEVSSVTPEMLQYNLAAPFFNRSLAALLNASSPPQPSSVAGVVNDEQQLAVPEVTQAPQEEAEVALSAVFVGDNNVPDSQMFPPGAEFVKSWRMLNDGVKAWPETTVLKLVVGESFARDRQPVKVGSVAPGAVIDLWTGELKAPEASGKYVSYWRLHDGQGNMFGHSVWIDITVAEQSSSERSTDSSLASSSIIMPQSAFAKSSASSDIVNEETVVMSTPVVVSLPRADDSASDNGSDGSSVSLISIPSSEDDDDPTIWEDSRTHAVLLPPDRARAGLEYVVLYDDSSSDEA